jgi:hypothetical protein
MADRCVWSVATPMFLNQWLDGLTVGGNDNGINVELALSNPKTKPVTFIVVKKNKAG